MATSSITQTVTPYAATPAATLHLHTRSSPQDRLSEILSKLCKSPIFSDEERACLVEAEETTEENPQEALIYLLVHTVQAAIVRLDSDIQVDLFNWEDELKDLLQEMLPEGQTADEEIENFIGIEKEISSLCEEIRGRDEHINTRNAIYAEANRTLEIIRRQESVNREFLKKCVTQLDAVTASVEELSSEERAVQEELTAVAVRVTAATDALASTHQSLLTLFAKGEETLRRISS